MGGVGSEGVVVLVGSVRPRYRTPFNHMFSVFQWILAMAFAVIAGLPLHALKRLESVH
jgi:hypothetical protein